MQNERTISVEGVFDIHVHAYPCLFPRIGDDWLIVDACRAAGMAGIVIKSHHESTASRAYLVGRRIEGISVLGGIVLNRYVGGLNPLAVAGCLATGGRVVWMPTVHAAGHAAVYGTVGGYAEQQASGRPAPGGAGDGIRILAGGRLVDEVFEILDLIREHDAVLATGHLSAEEIESLLRAARQRGVERVVVSHPNFKVPGMNLEQIRTCASAGAFIELTYCSISPMWSHATLEQYRAVIDAIGPERCLLSSDVGQRHNPLPPEAMRLLMQGLLEKGVSEAALRRMAVDNPRELVGR